MEIKKTWQIEQEHLKEKGQVWEKSDWKKWVAVDDLIKVIDNFPMNYTREMAGWDDCLRLLKKELNLNSQSNENKKEGK